MISVYRAAMAQARGDVGGTVAHARRALALAGPEDHFARSGGAGFVGMAAWAAGELRSAVDSFGEVVRSLHAAGMVADELGTTVVLGSIWLARGRPIEARRLYERALAAAESQPGAVLSTTGDLHVGLADVLRERGTSVRPRSISTSPANSAIGRRCWRTGHRWYTATAGLLQAEGDLEGAIAMLDEAEAPFSSPASSLTAADRPTRARVQILQGRLDGARASARERGVAPARSARPTWASTSSSRSPGCSSQKGTWARRLTCSTRAGRSVGRRARRQRDRGAPGADVVQYANGDTDSAADDLLPL